jgi:hypothetical protein
MTKFLNALALPSSVKEDVNDLITMITVLLQLEEVVTSKIGRELKSLKAQLKTALKSTDTLEAGFQLLGLLLQAQNLLDRLPDNIKDLVK